MTAIQQIMQRTNAVNDVRQMIMRMTQTVDDSNVEIPEEQTPLVDGDGNDGVVDIEESETPLANTAEDESTVSGDVDGNDADLAAQEIDAASVPVAVPVIGGIAAVFIAGLIAFLVYKNRKRSK